MAQIVYDRTAAAGYDRAFVHVSSHFIPFLLGAGCLAFGQKVLDVGMALGSPPKQRW